MSRALGMGTLVVLLALSGCKSSNGAEVVGDQCLPAELPSGTAGSGFMPRESYTTKSEACEGYPCLVDRLDNRNDAGVLADPSVLCEGSDPVPGCVTAQQVEQSVHCTCDCDGPGDRDKYCECPKGFTCRQLFTARADGLRNGPRGYCVKPR